MYEVSSFDEIRSHRPGSPIDRALLDHWADLLSVPRSPNVDDLVVQLKAKMTALNRRATVAIGEAAALEFEGNVLGAISRVELALASEISPFFREVYQAELNRLRQTT